MLTRQAKFGNHFCSCVLSEYNHYGSMIITWGIKFKSMWMAWSLDGRDWAVMTKLCVRFSSGHISVALLLFGKGFQGSISWGGSN